MPPDLRDKCILFPSHRSDETRVSSATYDLFVKAITVRKQIFCTCDGYARELCPHILGHTKGEEVALTYQFGGQSKSGLPPGGEWRCLALSKVRNARLQDGPWQLVPATPGRNPASISRTSTSTR